MKSQAAKRSRQRGVAAIEFSLVLPLLVLLLSVTLYFGRVCWHYTVAQKAAHDAVMMLANATKAEMSASKPDLSDIEIANLAKEVAAIEIAELNPGGGGPRVEVFCDSSACKGTTVPAQVRVQVTMKVTDIFFGAFTDELSGVEGIILTADVRMPYVGH
jgi:Flp pilus assembly protein TadG